MFGYLFQISFIVDPFEVEFDDIYRQFILSREVLFHASQEGLREEESANPEALRRAVVLPVFEKLDAVVKVVEPVGEWLDGEEATAGLFRPGGGHFVSHHSRAESFQLRVHDDAAAVSPHLQFQFLLHRAQQRVLPLGLLSQHGVHRLVVVGRLLHLEQLQVKLCWDFRLDLEGFFFVQVFG